MYARQRSGGVAWDAVPLTVTVRGLDKAAGNRDPPDRGMVVTTHEPSESVDHGQNIMLTMLQETCVLLLNSNLPIPPNATMVREAPYCDVVVAISLLRDR